MTKLTSGKKRLIDLIGDAKNFRDAMKGLQGRNIKTKSIVGERVMFEQCFNDFAIISAGWEEGTQKTMAIGVTRIEALHLYGSNIAYHLAQGHRKYAL